MKDFLSDLKAALDEVRLLIDELAEIEFNNETLGVHTDEMEEALEILYDEYYDLEKETLQ